MPANDHPSSINVLIRHVSRLVRHTDRLTRHIDRLTEHVDRQTSSLDSLVKQFEEAHAGRKLITLDQAAALVHRSKPALAHYKGRGLPRPAVAGGHGKPSLWEWSTLRPWLEETFGVTLPKIWSE